MTSVLDARPLINRVDMKAITKQFLACSASLSMVAAPVFADEQYKATIALQDGSPVTLNACEVWARDWNKTIGVSHVSIPNALIDVGVRFTNTSTKKLKDVRFAFVAYDAFATVVSSIELDTSEDVSADKVSMDPGAT